MACSAALAPGSCTQLFTLSVREQVTQYVCRHTSWLSFRAHQHQHIILKYGAGLGGLRSIAAALEQGAGGDEALLVRVAAGVYRERLVITRPMVVEAHPPVRPPLLWLPCWTRTGRACPLTCL